jgi:hypothetical protein
MSKTKRTEHHKSSRAQLLAEHTQSVFDIVPVKYLLLLFHIPIKLSQVVITRAAEGPLQGGSHNVSVNSRID